MSLRALRRLERDGKGDPLEQPNGSSNSEEESFHPKVSSFGLLALSEDEDEEDEEEEEEEGEKKEKEKAQTIIKEDLNNTKPAPPQKTKSKKASSSKSKTQDLSDDNSDLEYKSKFSANISELLDKLVLERERESLTEQIKTPLQEETNLFAADLDHLDPAVELRRKVGGNVADTVNNTSNLPESYIVKRMGPAFKQPRRYRKQLIVPRPAWTRVTSALVELRLERVEHEQYGSAFSLSPRPSYREQFEEFAMLVEAGDIQLVYDFAQRHPLHIDALLVVSDYMRMSSGSSADASELTERAVYILEKCTMATDEVGVDLTAGTLRLPYDHFDNRRMHLALIQYIQFLTKKGCYRCGLEFSKILWSLDPLVDPVGVRLIADFLAVQSQQYEWFESAYALICVEVPWMAGWHFSNALQLFLRGKSDADEALQRAIVENAWMIPRLAAACGLQVDESSWNGSFDITPRSSNDYVRALRDALTKIYSQRCGPLWRSPKACSWLETNIGIALSNRLDTPEEYQMEERWPDGFEALSVLRHTLISDLNVQVSLPGSISAGPVRLYDPLPPEEIQPEDFQGTQRCAIQ